MVDTAILKKRIDERGIKYRFIADKLGITYQALYNKIHNFRQFTFEEVIVLCDILDIKTLKEQKNIFLSN